jgi:DNA-binding SARP family transcriptional activator
MNVAPKNVVCPGFTIRMLGALEIRRDGRALALPASRKVRALFAYLALAPQAMSRSHLCELLWDMPGDRAANCAGA